MAPVDRVTRVNSQLPRWTDQLLDLSFKNTLLNFRLTKTTTLDLGDADQSAVSELLEGRQVRLASLFPEEEALTTARVQARNLARRIRLYDEEKGVDVGYLALGVVGWRVDHTSGPRRYRAPSVLSQLMLRPRGATQEEFDLKLVDEPVPNSVLLHVLRQHHGLNVDERALALDSPGPMGLRRHVEGVLRRIAEGRLDDFTVEDCLAAGVFSYEKLPIVHDLQSSGALLAEHDVVAALAGDMNARDQLQRAAETVSTPAPDSVPPEREFLVLDADSSQRRVIDTVLAGGHAVIEGPPGTGKSQTIANLIATLAARGKKVLFVAEKRAALDAVVDRLRAAGLTDLIFDLHAQTHDRKLIAQQLAASLRSAGEVTEPRPGDLFVKLVARREKLIAYLTALHQPHEPWGKSAYEVQTELSGLSDRSTGFRLHGHWLRQIAGRTRHDIEEGLQEYVSLGGLTVSAETTPWAGAQVYTEQHVRQMADLVNELSTGRLPAARRQLDEVLAVTGLRRPATVDGWQETLDLLRDVASTVHVHVEGIFRQPLDQLAAACATRKWRRQYGMEIGFWERRRLRKQSRRLRVDGQKSKGQLHRNLVAAWHQRARWAQLTVREGGPVVPPNLGQVTQEYQVLQGQLAVLGAVLASTHPAALSEDDAADTVRRLAEDRRTLRKLPRLYQLEKQLHDGGLGPLLSELAERGADVDNAAETFRWAWLRSVLDEIELRAPAYADFEPEHHNRCTEEFRKLDRRLHDVAAHKIRREVAKRLVTSLNAHPEQSSQIKREASKKTRHKPLRELVKVAPDVLLAARPCWAMSPLVVSGALPSLRLFDVVIFDEASQVRPADAIASIMRGTQLVVAGDEKQLPPTNFFTTAVDSDAADEDDEDEEVDAGESLQDYDSILGVLNAHLPQHRLTWHYRSKDERLIAFSNQHIYDAELVTFPGVVLERPIDHVLVPDAIARRGQGGSPEEVQEVVRLALDHAVHSPDLGLGIIAFGDTHARRIEKALWAALGERPELRTFFDRKDDGDWQRYFVKNVENVQGDERDAIILAVGYGRRSASGLAHNFGPLNKDGGERRLNVAITRARRRMTVVSSFGSAELDPARLSRRGARLLREFLAYAQHGDAALLDGPGNGAPEPNPFERDVLERLRAAGLDPHFQLGVAGFRIDFALRHPDPKRPRWLLAVEADGRTYHSAASARDRDRLRQEHLERLGWRFHRIWSPAWFRNPEAETEKVVAAYKRAVDEADRAESAAASAPTDPPLPQEPPSAQPSPPRLSRPYLGMKRASIEEYSPRELKKVVRWIRSDDLLRDDEELIREVMSCLGFSKLGRRIRERVTAAIRAVEREGR